MGIQVWTAQHLTFRGFSARQLGQQAIQLAGHQVKFSIRWWRVTVALKENSTGRLHRKTPLFLGPLTPLMEKLAPRLSMQHLTRRGCGMTPIPRRSRSCDSQVTRRTVLSVSYSIQAATASPSQTSHCPVLPTVTGSTQRLRNGPPQRSATAHKQTPTATRGPYRAQRSTLLLGRPCTGHASNSRNNARCSGQDNGHTSRRALFTAGPTCAPSRVNSSHNKWQQMKEHKKSSGLTCKWVNTIQHNIQLVQW